MPLPDLQVLFCTNTYSPGMLRDSVLAIHATSQCDLSKEASNGLTGVSGLCVDDVFLPALRRHSRQRRRTPEPSGDCSRGIFCVFRVYLSIDRGVLGKESNDTTLAVEAWKCGIISDRASIVAYCTIHRKPPTQEPIVAEVPNRWFRTLRPTSPALKMRQVRSLHFTSLQLQWVMPLALWSPQR